MAVSLILHPASGRLQPAMEHCLERAIPCRSDVFRYTAVPYSNPKDLLSGVGSYKAGGRWNPRRRFRTLYFSLDPETALAEMLRHRRSEGLPDVEATPAVLAGCRANVQRTLDLTDPGIRRVLGVSRNQIVEEPWRILQKQGEEALTQAIGRLACEAGFQGILAPSAARRTGRNLILFRDQIGSTELIIVHAVHLPKSRQ